MPASPPCYPAMAKAGPSGARTDVGCSLWTWDSLLCCLYPEGPVQAAHCLATWQWEAKLTVPTAAGCAGDAQPVQGSQGKGNSWTWALLAHAFICLWCHICLRT